MDQIYGFKQDRIKLNNINLHNIYIYIYIMKQNIKEKIYYIFLSSRFGIEIEACNNINTGYPEYKTLNPELLKLERQIALRSLYNTLIEHNVVPKMDNIYFKFANFLNYTPLGAGSQWEIHEDSTINCTNFDPRYDILLEDEIVSPIMYMGFDRYNSIYKKINRDSNILIEKNNLWIELEKNFHGENKDLETYGKDNYYYEGLFLIFTWYLLLFNNEFKLNNNGIPLISQLNIPYNGLHIHISNLKMENNFYGLLKLTHFLRTFYFFENLIGKFLTKNRENNNYCKKMSREHEINKHNNMIEYDTLLLKYINSEKITYDILHGLFTNYDKYFTINLQNKVGENLPIHLEIRYHQSTNNISEIYNWILFINCLLTNCIYEIDTIIKDIKNAYKYKKNIEENNKFLKINSSFVTEDLKKNNYVNINMFNLLFDRFIKNQTLKNFYRSKCRDLDLSDNTLITQVTDNLDFHPPTYFDENGKLRQNNPLNILQKNVNYNVWKLNPPEPYSKPINELLSSLGKTEFYSNDTTENVAKKNSLLSSQNINELLTGGYYFKKYLKYKYKYINQKK